MQMEMEAERKQLFDLALLQVLDVNRTRYGLTALAIGHHLARFAFTASNCRGEAAFTALIADRIEYLTQKGLVEEVLKVVNRDNRAWRITVAGIAHVDAH